MYVTLVSLSVMRLMWEGVPYIDMKSEPPEIPNDSKFLIKILESRMISFSNLHSKDLFGLYLPFPINFQFLY